MAEGLFGPSPWEIQQAQQQGLRQQAAAYAKQSPMERAAAGMYQAGGMLGGMGAEALGGKNIAVENARRTEQIMGEGDADLGTSAGMAAKADQFRKAGDLRTAAALTLKANEMKRQEQAAVLNTAKANYYNREKPDPKEIMMLEIADDPDESPEKRKMAADWLTRNGKGGAGGAGGSSQITRMIDPQTNTTYLVRTSKTPGAPSEVVSVTGQPVNQDVIDRLVEPAYSPTIAGNVASAKSGNTVVAKDAAGAMMALPKIENDLVVIKDLGTQLFDHPGYKSLVGAGFPGLKYLQGSAVPGAKALVDQIQGIGYLMAREELKGQGQVTEGEANAATAAFNRMNTATSEKDFRSAYDDFVKRVGNVREILRKKASMTFDQGQYRDAPVAPAVSATPSKPFSGVTTPQQVKDMVGKSITRDQARAILLDMKSRGIEIK